MSTKKEAKPEDVDKLIQMEWDTIEDLKKMLKDPSLTAAERIRAANALAYHACVLNKLCTQKGAEPRFNDVTLGEFITDVQTRMVYRLRKDFKLWTKKLSSKK